MSDEDLVFNDLTNINIQSLMGIVDIFKNLPYLFRLRNSLNLLEKETFQYKKTLSKIDSKFCPVELKSNSSLKLYRSRF